MHVNQQKFRVYFLALYHSKYICWYELVSWEIRTINVMMAKAYAASFFLTNFNVMKKRKRANDGKDEKEEIELLKLCLLASDEAEKVWELHD